MSISSLNPVSHLASQAPAAQLASRGRQLDETSQPQAAGEKSELRDAFDSFVGQTFYGLMMKTLRESTSKTPYFHGGRGEEVFQKQLDQIMVEEMTDASAESFTGPMYELFNLSRR